MREKGHHRAVIRHIVLWTFADGAPAAERDAVLAAIRGLRSKVPSLRTLEVGENVDRAGAQGYTHVAVATFDDRGGFAAYLAHPEHAPVGARMRAAAARVLVADLEV
jgi:hypothetical protein